jgi:hypothetical protein
MTSAGAVSIYSHMMAYGGRDDKLFRAGILQSGGAFPLEHPNTTAFQETFDSLIEDTSCSSFTNASAEEQLECIRQLPIETFLSHVGSSTGQSIDGSFSQTSIQFALPAGKYVKVATIVGSTNILPFPIFKSSPNPVQQIRMREPHRPQQPSTPQISSASHSVRIIYGITKKDYPKTNASQLTATSAPNPYPTQPYQSSYLSTPMTLARVAPTTQAQFL